MRRYAWSRIPKVRVEGMSACSQRYIYAPKKSSGRGIDVFASDGNPNPLHYYYSIGIGGTGVIANRSLDRFNIGYYYVDVSNSKFTGPLGAGNNFFCQLTL